MNVPYMNEILLKATPYFADWLEEQLSAKGADYWDSIVLSGLSFDQAEVVKKLGVKNLRGLDIAAVLNIIYKKWNNLSPRYRQCREDRNLINRLQQIRNKYSHRNEDVSDEELQSDLSVVRAVLSSLKLAPELQEELEPYRHVRRVQQPSAISTIVDLLAQTPNDLSSSTSDEIALMDTVFIKAMNKDGVVLGISGGAEKEYIVFVDGKKLPFYRNQICKKCELQIPFASLPLVRNYLSSFVASHPTTSHLYSLHAARINQIPYQFKPVMKIIQSDQPRLLIADGVGIGKTIEAGLILRELQIRNNVKSVLIICPRPLVAERKWEQEMKRFDESFEALDSKKLKVYLDECNLEGEWPEEHSKVILPYSICDERCLEQFNKMDIFPHFDLVIVDEAHHICRPSSIRHQVVRQFCDNAEAVVFLTATPLQLGNEDLYNLLNVLRPDRVPDKQTFDIIHTPNPFITRAVHHVRTREFELAYENLQKAVKTEGGQFVAGRLDYKQALEELGKQEFSREEVVELSEKISKLHTFSGLINRTLRNDVSEDFCTRHPTTYKTTMSDLEKEVYAELMLLKAELLRRFSGIENVNFVMTTLERQASSSLHGLAPIIGDILSRSFEAIYFDETDDEEQDIAGFSEEVLQYYRDRIEALSAKAKQLAGTRDDKFEKFYQIIQEKQGLENKKVIVFSTFRHTLYYLYELLQKKNIRVGLIHGDVDDAERLILRNRFEKESNDDDALDVLLFSEVGCEGLDYQFCDTMINYDLPWNPMKIEQRIGRIDRFGQKSDAVAIYNMIVENTIDADIYERCLMRINIFEESIGDCGEILGKIHSQIRSVCADTALSEEQRREKFEQIADNNCRNIRAQREYDKSKAALFSVPGRLSARDEFESFENYWISPEALESLVVSYLQSRGKGTLTGEGARKSLRLPSREDKQKLLEDCRQLPLREGKIYRDWERFLTDTTKQTCAVTFDIEEASRDKNIQFIMPLHPLVLAATQRFHAQMPISTALKVVANEIPEGDYPFLIEAWEYKGHTSDVKLKPFCENESVAQDLLNFLQVGAEFETEVGDVIQSEKLTALIRKRWDKETADFEQKVREQIDLQKNSLQVSANGRINQAQNIAIENIRCGRLAHIEEDTEKKLNELEEQAQSIAILRTPILQGIVKIMHEN